MKELSKLLDKIRLISSPTKFSDEYMSDDEIETLIKMMDRAAFDDASPEFRRSLDTAPPKAMENITYI